jgi:hypothetical protein
LLCQLNNDYILGFVLKGFGYVSSKVIVDRLFV